MTTTLRFTGNVMKKILGAIWVVIKAMVIGILFFREMGKPRPGSCSCGATIAPDAEYCPGCQYQMRSNQERNGGH